nr:unnamed protein product [Naegleria fowleri]
MGSCASLCSNSVTNDSSQTELPHQTMSPFIIMEYNSVVSKGQSAESSPKGDTKHTTSEESLSHISGSSSSEFSLSFSCTCTLSSSSHEKPHERKGVERVQKKPVTIRNQSIPFILVNEVHSARNRRMEGVRKDFLFTEHQKRDSAEESIWFDQEEHIQTFTFSSIILLNVFDSSV